MPKPAFSRKEKLAEWNNGEIYTLRRIVPEDRGKKWSPS